MIYVFDTSSFSPLKHFYPDVFVSMWSGLDDLYQAKQLELLLAENKQYIDKVFLIDVLENVVLDKDVKIGSNETLLGESGLPRVIAKGTTQGALMKS